MFLESIVTKSGVFSPTEAVDGALIPSRSVSAFAVEPTVWVMSLIPRLPMSAAAELMFP